MLALHPQVVHERGLRLFLGAVHAADGAQLRRKFDQSRLGSSPQPGQTISKGPSVVMSQTRVPSPLSTSLPSRRRTLAVPLSWPSIPERIIVMPPSCRKAPDRSGILVTRPAGMPATVLYAGPLGRRQQPCGGRTLAAYRSLRIEGSAWCLRRPRKTQPRHSSARGTACCTRPTPAQRSSTSAAPTNRE